MINHQVLSLLDSKQLVPMLRLHGQAFVMVVRPKRRVDNGLVSSYTLLYQKTGSDPQLPQKVIPDNEDSGMVNVSRMWLSHMLDVGIVQRVQQLVGLSYRDVE